MENPFFSIVVPTKNRANYLGDTILSVLLQKFNDYELIVSDNFNNSQTKKVIDRFTYDSRLKYYRTDREMNMIDHWEYATLKAKGKYVLLLTDRKVLYQNSLKYLHKIITDYPEIDVFSFAVKIFDDRNNKIGWIPPNYKTKIFETSLLIENFLNKNIFTDQSSLDICFPKTLNGIYKNSFAEKARSVSGRYFNNLGVSTPDYSSFFINLALNNKVLFIGKPVLLTQGEHTSNGRNFGKGNYKSYLNTLNKNYLFEKVPTKLPFIYNLLVNDFLVIRDIFKGNLVDYEPNWQNYYLTNYFEFLVKKKSGVLNETELMAFRAEWEKSLESEKNSIKNGVMKMINETTEIFNTPNRFKITGIMYHIRDFVNYRFSHIKPVNRLINYRFENVLEAAGFKKF